MKNLWWIAWALLLSPIYAQGDEVLIGYGYEPSVAANEKRNGLQDYLYGDHVDAQERPGEGGDWPHGDHE